MCCPTERRSNLGANTQDVEVEWKQIRLILRVPNDMQMRVHGTEDESVESPIDSSVGLSLSTKAGIK